MQSVSVQIVGFGVEILAHLYVLKQRHSDVPDRAYARSSQKMYEHVMLTVDPPKLRFSQHVRTHHLKSRNNIQTSRHQG